MPNRSLLLLLLLCSLVLQAESCWYPGPGGLRAGGEDDGNIIDDPEGRCTELPSSELPGLAFIPRMGGGVVPGPLWVVNPPPSQGLLAFDVDELPPASRVPSWDVAIPADSDGDGVDEGAPGVLPLPIVNGVRIESNTLGLITAHNYDEVLFFLNALGEVDNTVDEGLTRYLVSVSTPEFGVDDYPRLPAPGADPASRTAVSTKACVRASGKNYSDGSNPLLIPSDDQCVAGDAQTYYSESTTGATVSEWIDVVGGVSVVKSRLFVSLNNPDSVPLSGERIYRPGTVLAYDFSDISVSPVPDMPVGDPPSVIFTEGYNPRNVIGYTTTSGDNFVLVVVGGAVGFDGGKFVKIVPSEAFVEVIDPASLEVIDRVSLGNAALSGNFALDPIKRVLAVGSVAERTLYGIDLERLTNPAAPWNVTQLDITPLDPAVCPGSIGGMSISDDLSEIYAVDTCDGILTVVEADVDGTLHEVRQIPLTAPINEPVPDPAEIVLKAPGQIAVRPGTPGTSFEGSDLFVLVSQPEGRVCAQEVFGK